jgi:TolA-binding protein
MSFLGRVLVVIHLVLSVMFMAFAGAVYTAQTNWKTQHANAKKQLEQAQQKATTDVAAVQTQLDQLNQKFTQLQNEKTTLEGQAKTLADNNARLDADNKQLKTEADTFRTNAQLASQEAEERKEESKIQRARNADLNTSRNTIVGELNSERDTIFGLNLQLSQQKEKYEKLLKDSAIMRAYLASKDLPVDTRQMTVESSPPPPVEGKVVDARKEVKGSRVYVEISLGQDDGLVAGHTMTVYSGDKYKGKIRLQDVWPDKSVGVVLETAPNSKIEKEDRVTTKL